MPDFITIPQSLTSYRLANARVPVCLVADAAQLKPDADGLAPCDIVIENGRIAAIGPAAAADGLPRFDLDNGIVLPRLVDVHTHIDKGHIWQRAPNPDGTFMGARMTVMADREANWSRRGRAQAHGLFAALRLRARHRRAAHAYRQLSASRRAISWGVFAEMREQWKGRVALQAAVALSDRMRDRRRAAVPRAWSRPSRSTAACSAGSPSSASRSTAKTDAALDKVFEAAKANGLDLDFHVDESDSPLARSLRAHRRGRAAPQVRGQDRRRALLLARARRRRRARHDHRQGRGGRASRSCRCRCATCICRIAWPAARRAGAASRRCMSSMPRASP